MPDPPPKSAQHGVVITLREVWDQGNETREMMGELTRQIGELVPLNKRLDAHGVSIHEHDQRLEKIEIAQAVAQAQQRPRAPWYVVVGAVVGIVSGVAGLFAVLAYLSQISSALGG